MNSLLPVYQAILAGHQDFDIQEMPEKLFDFALEAGFGPLLQHCSQASVHSGYRNRLLGADMTARLLTGKQLDALAAFVDAAPETASIVVLKGMSAALHYYPQPTMRTMGDIDILVPVDQQAEMENICLELGYVRKSHLPEEFYVDLHHSMPLYHPDHDVWIELHTALFPPHSVAAADYAFRQDNVKRESARVVPVQAGVKSLSQELELLYVCAHWAVETNWRKAGLRMLDALYILRGSSQLDWEKVFSWLERSPVSANSTYLMISFLQNHQLTNIPAEVIRRLAASARDISPLNQRILHRMIDAYSMRGRSFGRLLSASNISIVWSTLVFSSGSPLTALFVRTPLNIALPPSSPRRYDFQFQWSRLRNLLWRS